MENIIYNELIHRGYSVDIGVVYDRAKNQNGHSVRVAREIDFIATLGSKKVYIQSPYAMPTEEKRSAELRAFELTGDFFPKIVIRRNVAKSWYDEKGVLNVNIIDFLLDGTIV